MAVAKAGGFKAAKKGGATTTKTQQKKTGGTNTAKKGKNSSAKKKPLAADTEAIQESTSAVLERITMTSAKEAALKTFTDASSSSEELRHSLSNLFELAAKMGLHSAKCRPAKVGRVIPKFPVSKVVTQKSAASTEQLWGQLNVVYTPVLNTLKGALEADSADMEAATASSKKQQNQQQAEEDEEGEENFEEEGADEEDEEEEMTFGENDGPKKDKKPKKDVPEKDKWRYAFGAGNDAFDDDEEEEELDEEDRKDFIRNSGAFDEDGEDEEEDFNDDGDGDYVDGMNDRGHRDGDYAEDDFGEDDGDFSDDPEDDAAALRELYGEDAEFDEDDLPFGGRDDDLDEDAMDDLELPGEEGEDQDDDGGHRAHNRQRQQAEEGAWGEEEEEEGDVLDGDNYDWDDDGRALEALSRKKKVRFDDEDDGDDNDDGDDADDANEEDDGGEESTFQRMERKRLRSIQDLEESRLFNKDWTMSGETAGKDRGRDALLDEKLEFEHAMKSVPVITQQITERLESRIKKRIIDGNFDDVERRQTRTIAGDLNTTKKDAAIDSQKSKHSLVDLYEKDFLERQRKADEAVNGGPAAQNAEPLTEIEKDELKAIAQWKRLSQHLDAMSNFFFTPKPVQEDVSARVRAVEGQAPAIALESVGVLGVSSKEAAVAPQDLFRAHKDKFVGVAKEEMTPGEKQALRRAKKTAGKEKKDRLESMKNQRETAARKKKAAAEEAES